MGALITKCFSNKRYGTHTQIVIVVSSQIPCFESVVVGGTLDKEVKRLGEFLERFSGKEVLPENFAADAVQAVQLAVACRSHDDLGGNIIN
jgi:hypothetical protein